VLQETKVAQGVIKPAAGQEDRNHMLLWHTLWARWQKCSLHSVQQSASMQQEQHGSSSDSVQPAH
jgi:hypothetical protein